VRKPFLLKRGARFFFSSKNADLGSQEGGAGCLTRAMAAVGVGVGQVGSRRAAP
jgi:hypothetical protein